VASHQRSRGSSGNADAAHSAGNSDWTTGESNASPGTQPPPSRSSPQTSPACSVQNGRPSVDVGADCLRVAAAMLSPLKLGTRRCYRAAL
jgi:hypothetical protein